MAVITPDTGTRMTRADRPHFTCCVCHAGRCQQHLPPSLSSIPSFAAVAILCARDADTRRSETAIKNILIYLPLLRMEGLKLEDGTDQVWELEQGIPQPHEPVIQKYFQGRDALINQEEKQRSGS